MNNKSIGASFRDPCGFVFSEKGRLFRQINKRGREDFAHLIESGLYRCLADAGLLIAHRDTGETCGNGDGWKIIEPVRIPFISYPWEWCFSELHAAAVATLHLCRIALEYDMILKDASAFNIQFNGIAPLCIDTLSFTRYREGEPWIAYGQFCRHFLAPLLLAAKRDVRIVQLSGRYLDGIPLDLAVGLAPWRCRLDPSLFFHLYLHASLQRRAANRKIKPGTKSSFSRNAFCGLLDNLESTLRRLRPKKTESAWSGYYDRTNYSAEAFEHKQRCVDTMLKELACRSVWDMGANDGTFSRIAARHGAMVVSFDLDHEVVERSFIHCRQSGITTVLPLLTDLANPGSACGWAHRERMSLAERGPADAMLALALVHHIAIGNNIPFENIARYFCELAGHLIIEFVPKDDSQVVGMLATREDIFGTYSREYFERSFERFFSIEERVPVADCMRTLYRMKNRCPPRSPEKLPPIDSGSESAYG